jgi:tetratricopeptide (TPR) repeat protein
MKSLRSPLAIAAAALMAAPPAISQPMTLTPEAAPPPAPAPGAPSVVVEIPPSEAPGPLPADLSLAQAPPPPPAPEAAPEPAPEPAPSPPPPPPAPPPAPPRFSPPATATVSVGLQEGYTRLSFVFSSPTTLTPLLQGERLDLRFSRAADLDIADLRGTPPRFVREVRRANAAGAPVRLALTLEPGVRLRHFVDGNRVVVDLLAPEAPPPGAPPPRGTETAAPAPTPSRPPVSGVGRVQLVEEADVTRISVTWSGVARASAFRRGEAIWLLFDATGRMDITGVLRSGRRHRDIEVVQGEGVIGLRIPAEPNIVVSANADGSTWSFTLGASANPSATAPLTREITPDGRGHLTARFDREGVVRWIRDPEIGDRIGVALIGGPALGVDTRRATVEAAVLPAAHGAVIETRADDVTASIVGGVLRVTRGDGLIAAAPNPANAIEGALSEAERMDDGVEQPAPIPGMTLAQVRERLDELNREAAEEGVAPGAPVEARMELARFLLQNDFAPEALGALRIVAINQGELVELDPEFRLLRGAANVMMGRTNEAMADLGASSLANNPSAALWRGYAASLRKDWAEARRELERGASALEEHHPGWRARFQLALAEAALELNDHAVAEASARAAMNEAPDTPMRLRARYIQARLAGVRGDTDTALAMLDELARVRDEEVAVRASVEAIRLRRAGGVMRAVDAIEPLEALRFRWRGDATELRIVGMLGDVYSELGRWRDALTTMRVAADRFPNDLATRQLRADMTNLFERLFLDGEADRLEPIQSLALFYEFSDLTPVGPNGDRMVRLLAGRLVHVDLLEQAAQLLQHQVDERLEGISKAQVAADLAAIYLMDGKPDRALVAISSTRQPNMPATLLGDRRILEARALLALGRVEGAAELVERDQSEDAQRVRADAAWRARDWAQASTELRRLLGMRNRAQPLDDQGRQDVLRAGIALTLAGDEEGVRTLYREYAGDMSGTAEADSFEVIASGVQANGTAIRDVARTVARTDLLDRFMRRLRERMTAEAAAAPTTPAPTTPAPPTAAPGA